MPTWNYPDPTYDADATTLTQAVDALATMIGAVLEPLGLDPRYSHSLPPEQVSLSPDSSGPVAVHVGGSDAPVTLEIYDGCMVKAQFTIHSYYFVTPLQAERADAWAATQGWLLPILRAMFANQKLGNLPGVERCLPVQVDWVGEMAYGDHTYTGLIVTSHIWIDYQMEVIFPEV